MYSDDGDQLAALPLYHVRFVPVLQPNFKLIKKLGNTRCAVGGRESFADST